MEVLNSQYQSSIPHIKISATVKTLSHPTISTPPSERADVASQGF